MKTKLGLAAALMLVAVHIANATETLQSCAAKPDTDRLACYDQLAKDTVSTIQQSPVSAPSQWAVQTEISPINDAKNVFLQVEGTNGIKDQYGRDQELLLTLACRENVTAAILHFGGHFMSDLNSGGKVTYRVDTLPAKTKTFEVSNNNESLGLWSGATAIPWIKSLFGGTKMYVEATPMSENQVNDFLPIAGLEEAIKPLREACKW